MLYQIRLFLLALGLVISPSLFANLLQDLQLRITFTTELPNDSLEVSGLFNNQVLAGNRPHPDFYFTDVLLSGDTKTYTVKAPPIIIANFQLGTEVAFPLALRSQELLSLQVHRHMNGTLNVNIPTPYKSISDYIAEHWILPILDYGQDNFAQDLTTLQEYELNKLEGLPSWFVTYQAKRIKIFYAQILIRYHRQQDAVSMVAPPLLLEDALIHDKLYHNYLSSWLRNTYGAIWDSLGETSPEKEIRAILQDQHIDSNTKDIFLLREALILDGSKGKNIGSDLEELALSGIQNPDYYNYFREREFVRALPEGIPAFDFALVDTLGNIRQLSDFRGKVVLLSFWFPNCASCIAEFTAEQVLHDKYAQQDFELVGICTWCDQEAWKGFLRSHQVSYTSLFASRTKTAQLEQQYQITTYPNFVLIDREGRIWQDKTRRPSDPMLQEAIDKALNR